MRKTFVPRIELLEVYHMKKFSFVIAVVLCLTTGLFAQENETEQNKGLSHTQVAATAYVPYFGTMLLSQTQLFVPPETLSPVLCAGSALLNIPAAIVNPKYTLIGTAITETSWAGGILLSKYPNIFGNPSLASMITNFGLKGNMWLQYKGYETARTMATPGIYKDYETLSIKDIVTAPFNPNILSQKSVWIPILGIGSAIIALDCLNGFDKSVFATGESYLGNYKLPVAAGLATVLAFSCVNFTLTGAGEEALFRGTGYEEMKVSFGTIPAKLVDAVLFPCVHIPQQVVAGLNWSSILITTLEQSAVTFLLQWIYDYSGLQSSIATHMWIDVISYVCAFAFTGGVENNDFSLNINFSMKL